MEKLFSKIKEDWTIIKTSNIKPFGFIGYEITIYKKNSNEFKCELRAKTLKGLVSKIKKLKVGK